MAGQYWRLLTPAFLHGSLIHLAVNSSSLNSLGPLLEARAGHARFLVAYLLAGVAGNVASFLGSTTPSLGASGGRRRRRRQWQQGPAGLCSVLCGERAVHGWMLGGGQGTAGRGAARPTHQHKSGAALLALARPSSRASAHAG